VSCPAAWAWSCSAWGFGAFLDPHALLVVGVVRLGDGFVVEVPAFAALGRP
jgi:hypothetical protein